MPGLVFPLPRFSDFQQFPENDYRREILSLACPCEGVSGEACEAELIVLLAITAGASGIFTQFSHLFGQFVYLLAQLLDLASNEREFISFGVFSVLPLKLFMHLFCLLFKMLGNVI